MALVYFQPARILTVNYATQSAIGFFSGDPNDIWNGFPYQWNVILTVQNPQLNSFPPNFQYDGTNIGVGDWISTGTGGLSVKIISINNQGSSTIDCNVEDVDRFNTLTDPTQTGNGNILDGIGYVFSLGDDGLPILAGQQLSVIPPEFQGDILTKFMYRNYLKSYRRVDQVGNTFAIGDMVYIDSTETYQHAIAGVAGVNVVGFVSSIGIPTPDWFTWKAHGIVVETFNPILPGVAGQAIYLDPTTPGGKTVTKPNAWAKPIYIQLTNDGTQGILLERNIDSIQTDNGYASQVYKVADIASRDALAGIVNIGDQVFVQDMGNGDYGHYLYSGSGFVLLTTANSSKSVSKSVSYVLTPTSPATVLLSDVPDTASIISISINVTTIFDSNPSFTIGTADSQSLFVDATAYDLSAIGEYEVEPDYQFNTGGANTEINIYFTPSSSIVGSSTITISYC